MAVRIVKDNKVCLRVYYGRALALLWQKSSRVIREEGWRNFVRKATGKIRGKQTRPHSRLSLAENVPFDVVIPATTSFEALKRTIESVLSCTEGIAFRLVVLTDASTDEITQEYLKYLQNRLPHIVTRDSLQERPLPEIVVIQNPRYLSFIQQVNNGLSCTERDVVLLYGYKASTLFPGVLKRLFQAAYSDERTACVVPLSTSLVPSVCQGARHTKEGIIPSCAENRFAELALRAIPVPTILGPCVFIKKKVLNEIGGFDARFGSWREASNAFSMKLRRQGYQITVDLSTFVECKFPTTLEDELIHLRNNKNSLFSREYPEYVSQVKDFVYYVSLAQQFVPKIVFRDAEKNRVDNIRKGTPRLRIGIDAQLLAHKWQVGTKRYTVELIKHLLRVDSEKRYILYTGGDVLHDPDFDGCTKRFVLNSADILLDSEKIDVFHRTNHAFSLYDVLTLLKAKASVITIHDLILYHNSSYAPSSQEHVRYRQLMELSAQVADIVIVVSEYTKHDVVSSLRIPSEKVVVTHLGADPHKFQVSRIETGIKAKYGIGPEYILYTGSDFPHKNLKNLILAFRKLVETKHIHYVLALVGPTFSCVERKELGAMVEELGERVKFLGYVSDEDLVSLYKGASLYVFPSLYEGFGIPPLEAMACGTPVVASKATSIPEVVGDAALMVDCTDVDELAAAIHRVLNNEKLRNSLIQKGFQRAKEFQWERTVAKTLDIYEKAYRISVGAHRKLSKNTKSEIVHLLSKGKREYAVLQEITDKLAEMVTHN